MIWILPLPAEPRVFAGYAYGSGDSSPGEGSDASFHQTGLQGNESGFGGGYLHHLTRYDPKTGKAEDLGVLTVKNPDYCDWEVAGKPKPYRHGFHKLPDGTLTPLHHHMAMIVGRDGTVYVTVLYPFTLLMLAPQS